MSTALSRPRMIAAITLALALAQTSATAMTAGAGRAPIVLEAKLLPFQNFTYEADPLKVRALIIDQNGRKAAIVVLDMTSLFDGEIHDVRAIVQDLAGIPADHTLVIASHTFSAPHIFPVRAATSPPPPANPQGDDSAKMAALHDAVNAAVRAAVSEAITAMRPATLSFGTGYSDVNVNRNVKTAQGWWLGANETGPSDKLVQVLRIDDASGQPLAALTNYAVQSAIMDQSGGRNGTKAITADLAGAAMDHVEKRAGRGMISLFLIGAAGDQVPAYTARRHLLDKDGIAHVEDAGEAALPLVRLEGERLGSAMSDALAKARPIRLGALDVIHSAVALATQERSRELGQLHPVTRYTYPLTGHAADAPFAVLVLGDVALVGVQVELSASTGAWIRAHSPFAHTMVVTMVNGAAKYLTDAKGYADITYEAMNANYAPGGAEKLAAAIVTTLRQAASRQR